jgi:flagellin
MITMGALSKSTSAFTKSLEKLSTGLRINRASDDAAGLSVSEGLRTQIGGMTVAKRNASDGIALMQIAEGAAGEISNLLQRMRELAVQSSNDTLTTTERTYTNQEFAALLSEVDRVTNSTQYNGQTLIAGGASSFGGAGSVSSVLHIGPNGTSINKITLSINATSSGALSMTNTSVSTQSAAQNAITSIDTAITSVNAMRGNLGAIINRLESAINNLDNQIQNSQSAESLIRDVDFAQESTTFTKNQIMMQSGTAMLAQANAAPQTILGLIGR